MRHYILAGLLVIFFIYAWILTTPPQRESELVEVVVEKGDNFPILANKLKEKGVIRSELAFKAYVRLNPIDTLYACHYQLDKSWNFSQIMTELDQVCTHNENAVQVTIPEGRTLKQIATRIAEVTNNTEEELLDFWNSEEFIEQVTEKYDFITTDIKQKDIIYPLEGYFFPARYELKDADVDPEYVAFRFLDQTAVIYNKYEEDIEKSNFTFHEILTFASIVEHEAVYDEDRPVIAGVFYNRLAQNRRLESCATLGYALGTWKTVYTIADTETEHPYNTYRNLGLPPGPGNAPGEKSIQAVLNPAETDYLYFRAAVCDLNDNKTYFSKTYDEHRRIGRELRKQCD